jgi:hypothetical protein
MQRGGASLEGNNAGRSVGGGVYARMGAYSLFFPVGFLSVCVGICTSNMTSHASRFRLCKFGAPFCQADTQRVGKLETELAAARAEVAATKRALQDVSACGRSIVRRTF